MLSVSGGSTGRGGFCRKGVLGNWAIMGGLLVKKSLDSCSSREE
jgi:hypothetical protein